MFKFRSVQQRSCFVQTAVFKVWNTWEIPSTVDKMEGGREGGREGETGLIQKPHQCSNALRLPGL